MASGTSMGRVVKTNVLLMRAADFDEMNRIYSSYFPEESIPPVQRLWSRAFRIQTFFWR